MSIAAGVPLAAMKVQHPNAADTLQSSSGSWSQCDAASLAGSHRQQYKADSCHAQHALLGGGDGLCHVPGERSNGRGCRGGQDAVQRGRHHLQGEFVDRSEPCLSPVQAILSPNLLFKPLDCA